MILSYSRSQRRMSAQVSAKKPMVIPTNSASLMTLPPFDVAEGGEANFLTPSLRFQSGI